MFKRRRENSLHDQRDRLKPRFRNNPNESPMGIFRAARLRSRIPHQENAPPALPQLTEPISLRTPLALLVISLGMIALVWWWLATPVMLARAPIDPAAKLDCISYAPYRGEQNPLTPGLVIDRELIAADMAQLAAISKCVRTYSTGNGLDQLPELAGKVGLKVLLGIWIGTSLLENTRQIETAIGLVKDYPDTVSGVIVGSEVLLRREMTASDLSRIIRSVKARVGVPVTYADVWEYWLSNREVSDAVDFVTIHILPYWEDFPIAARFAAAHIADIRKRTAAAFPDKEILIGETGWPSAGRMREGALPSRTNQARIISEILDLAKRENFRVNLIEAYDQPWKRQFEGTVGGNWGLMDASERAVKYPIGVPVGDYPYWKMQMGLGMGLSVLVFAAALFTPRRMRRTPGFASWLAIALSATVAGTLLGLAADKLVHESYSIGDWLRWGTLLAVGIAAPLLCANALISRRALPTFIELMGPIAGRTRSIWSVMMGAALLVATLIGIETALGLVFDPRYRDFPLAALTMAVVPLSSVMVLNRPRLGSRPIAERLFAGLFVMAALYIGFNEGRDNWQSLWTCAIYGLFGLTLWQARAGQIPMSSPSDVDLSTTL
jgi:exo-beta-1,3-glucanase (GH17 family)